MEKRASATKTSNEPIPAWSSWNSKYGETAIILYVTMS
jgi:hypothetical protein